MKFTAIVALVASVNAVKVRSQTSAHEHVRANEEAIARMREVEDVAGWWKDMKQKYNLAQKEEKEGEHHKRREEEEESSK